MNTTYKVCVRVTEIHNSGSTVGHWINRGVVIPTVSSGAVLDLGTNGWSLTLPVSVSGWDNGYEDWDNQNDPGAWVEAWAVASVSMSKELYVIGVFTVTADRAPTVTLSSVSLSGSYSNGVWTSDTVAPGYYLVSISLTSDASSSIYSITGINIPVNTSQTLSAPTDLTANIVPNQTSGLLPIIVTWTDANSAWKTELIRTDISGIYIETLSVSATSGYIYQAPHISTTYYFAVRKAINNGTYSTSVSCTASAMREWFYSQDSTISGTISVPTDVNRMFIECIGQGTGRVRATGGTGGSYGRVNAKPVMAGASVWFYMNGVFPYTNSVNYDGSLICAGSSAGSSPFGDVTFYGGGGGDNGGGGGAAGSNGNGIAGHSNLGGAAGASLGAGYHDGGAGSPLGVNGKPYGGGSGEGGFCARGLVYIRMFAV
jgi:hypothetical protein